MSLANARGGLKAFYHDRANPRISAFTEAAIEAKNILVVLNGTHLGGCLVARLSSSSILETLQVFAVRPPGCAGFFLNISVQARAVSAGAAGQRPEYL